MADQERALVQALASHPGRDFVVALAGVARSASRRDIVECVTSPARDGKHAVALHRSLGRAAVRAATPRGLHCRPLLVREVVLDTSHPPLATPRHPRTSAPVDRHGDSVDTLTGDVRETRLPEHINAMADGFWPGAPYGAYGYHAAKRCRFRHHLGGRTTGSRSCATRAVRAYGRFGRCTRKGPHPEGSAGPSRASPGQRDGGVIRICADWLPAEVFTTCTLVLYVTPSSAGLPVPKGVTVYPSRP